MFVFGYVNSWIFCTCIFAIAMETAFAKDSTNNNDDNEKPSEFDLEGILSDLGSFGKFQIFIYSSIILPILLVSCFGLSYIFTTGQLEYR